MLNYVDKVLVGVAALLIARVLTALVDSFCDVLPGYWLYVAMIPLIILVAWVGAQVPRPFWYWLQFRNRYQVVCACAIAGLALGLRGV